MPKRLALSIGVAAAAVFVAASRADERVTK
jgi:hypothetical protein